jgi:N-acetylmuramidase-like protein
MIDYKKAAQILGVDEASVKAISSVESAGDGFITDKDGNKIPKILFERHVMFKRLRDFTLIKSADMAAKYPDIVNPTPGGYKGGLAEHERLDRAVKIDRVTALESASWGAYQIMAYHWKVLGYSSVQEFVNKAYTEEGQLELFIRFVKASPNVLKALKAKDWVGVARAYNGPGYAKNSYHIKMKEAYEQFSKE